MTSSTNPSPEPSDATLGFRPSSSDQLLDTPTPVSQAESPRPLRGYSPCNHPGRVKPQTMSSLVPNCGVSPYDEGPPTASTSELRRVLEEQSTSFDDGATPLMHTDVDEIERLSALSEQALFDICVDFSSEKMLELFFQLPQFKASSSLVVLFASQHACVRECVLADTVTVRANLYSYTLQVEFVNPLPLPDVMNRFTGFVTSLNTMSIVEEGENVYFLNDTLALAIKDRAAAEVFLQSTATIGIDALQQQLFVRLHFPELLQAWLDASEEVFELPNEVLLGVAIYLEQSGLRVKRSDEINGMVKELRDVVAFLTDPVDKLTSRRVDKAMESITRQILKLFKRTDVKLELKDKFSRFWQYVCLSHPMLRDPWYAQMIQSMQADLKAKRTPLMFFSTYHVVFKLIERGDLGEKHIKQLLALPFTEAFYQQPQVLDQWLMSMLSNLVFAKHLFDMQPEIIKALENRDHCSSLHLFFVRLYAQSPTVLSMMFANPQYFSTLSATGSYLYELYMAIDPLVRPLSADFLPSDSVCQQRFLAVCELQAVCAQQPIGSQKIERLLDQAVFNVKLLHVLTSSAHNLAPDCLALMVKRLRPEDIAMAWQLQLSWADLFKREPGLLDAFLERKDLLLALNHDQLKDLLLTRQDDIDVRVAEKVRIPSEVIETLEKMRSQDFSSGFRSTSLARPRSQIFKLQDEAHAVEFFDTHELTSSPQRRSTSGMPAVPSSEASQTDFQQYMEALQSLEHLSEEELTPQIYEAMAQSIGFAHYVLAETTWLQENFSLAGILRLLRRYMPTDKTFDLLIEQLMCVRVTEQKLLSEVSGIGGTMDDFRFLLGDNQCSRHQVLKALFLYYEQLKQFARAYLYALDPVLSFPNLPTQHQKFIEYLAAYPELEPVPESNRAFHLADDETQVIAHVFKMLLLHPSSFRSALCELKPSLLLRIAVLLAAEVYQVISHSNYMSHLELIADRVASVLQTASLTGALWYQTAIDTLVSSDYPIYTGLLLERLKDAPLVIADLKQAVLSYSLRLGAAIKNNSKDITAYWRLLVVSAGTSVWALRSREIPNVWDQYYEHDKRNKQASKRDRSSSAYSLISDIVRYLLLLHCQLREDSKNLDSPEKIQRVMLEIQVLQALAHLVDVRMFSAQIDEKVYLPALSEVEERFKRAGVETDGYGNTSALFKKVRHELRPRSPRKSSGGFLARFGLGKK